MIIQKQTFNPSTVVSIRLTSGDEIVASYVDMDALTILVKNPLVIRVTPEGTVGVDPFMFGIERNAVVPISRSSVTVIIKTHDLLTNDYLNMINAGETTS